MYVCMCASVCWAGCVACMVVLSSLLQGRCRCRWLQAGPQLSPDGGWRMADGRWQPSQQLSICPSESTTWHINRPFPPAFPLLCLLPKPVPLFPPLILLIYRLVLYLSVPQPILLALALVPIVRKTTETKRTLLLSRYLEEAKEAQEKKDPHVEAP
ncbi:hypothetical protein B0I35DRAFT_122774 [Stachybotrys elegans]|uniref:Uncharacterized protein n=1 Tax=Stachybotrys elegans TaxID=80388 RepID=A0A8K0SVH8_9HYPO|nr:hypothetical protein B0I35DRAFT_122774 [Stachybotrys elegans]